MFSDLNVVGLKESSGWQKVRCPLCSKGRNKSTEPCLSIDVSTGGFVCWHCGWVGNVNGKGKEYKPNYTPIDSKRQTALPQPAKDWLISERGITEAVINRNNIKAETRLDRTGTKKKYIVFNYYLGNQIVNAKYRTKDKDFQSAKAAAPIFYKLNDVFESDTVIITEGEIDALTYEVAGYNYAISIPNGGFIPKGDKVIEYKYIDECLPYLQDVKRFLISTDNDLVGRYLQREFIRRFGKQRCYKITYPTDCKDANEVLTTHGIEAVRAMVSSATLFPAQDVYTMSSRKDEFVQLWRHGYIHGATTGVPIFDRHLKYFTGMFHVVTGIPGDGKSTWVDYQSTLLAVSNGWHVAYYTPENKDLELHGQRIASQFIGQPFIPGFEKQMSEEQMIKAYEFINEYYHYVYPNKIVSLAEIHEAFDFEVQKHGCKLCIVDPWNTVEQQIPKYMNADQYYAKALNDMKYFARDHDVHYILVAHPTKMETNQDGTYKKPKLYNIAGSAHFKNIPDYGTIIYKTLQGNMMVDHEKIKHPQFMGIGGSSEYNFERETQRYWIDGYDRYRDLSLQLDKLETEPIEDLSKYENPPF